MLMRVLMEHPPKQGLKHGETPCPNDVCCVLMEHPPKQGLKPQFREPRTIRIQVLMEHPPKQGLKHMALCERRLEGCCFNGTSTKTRIETRISLFFSQ